eukprot:CAMPEP_0180653250 /NCGR_PEP_ID=MMETSP1037_2-20121125/53975_1 /TAXON_ID=632150 /ORGANISM="Azadinium spinosum, Strain 3D9" /LENGTH=70 /DNA_ID=CAMNT_0022679267 /DNA_START=322 /DNA_END=530 /DNA_ORIENTATION=-
MAILANVGEPMMLTQTLLKCEKSEGKRRIRNNFNVVRQVSTVPPEDNKATGNAAKTSMSNHECAYNEAMR